MADIKFERERLGQLIRPVTQEKGLEECSEKGEGCKGV